MEKLGKYTIPFTGLKHGIHEFSLDVNKEFFDENGFSVENNSCVEVSIKLEIQSTLMQLWLSLNGNIIVPCDRCNHSMNVLFESEHKVIIKYREEDNSESDEIIMLSEGDTEIDLSQQIFEFLTLDIPIKNVHEEGNCDAETLKIIEKYSVPDKGPETDPRWDSLKNINFK